MPEYTIHGLSTAITLHEDDDAIVSEMEKLPLRAVKLIRRQSYSKTAEIRIKNCISIKSDVMHERSITLPESNGNDSDV